MLTAALARAGEAAGTCADAPVWPLADHELVTALEAVHAVEQRLAAARLHLIREIERRRLPVTQHATSTAVWLRELLRVSIHTAKRMAELARALDRRPALDTALAAAAVTVDQAQAIAAALDDLPAELGEAVVDKAEAVLIGHAAHVEPVALRRLGARVLDQVAPDLADDVQAAVLARQEAHAHAARTVTLTAVGAGRVRLTGWLDTESAAIVAAALDPLCTPRPGDERTPGQRRADALTDICRLASACGQLPDNGGDRPQIVVTVPHDVLLDRLRAGPTAGTGRLDTGERLTAEQVRRLACDAQILPAVLGGQGQALDLGQTRRLFTGPVRRALVLRDGGCAFPGCDRPPRWCDAHHILAWTAGGATTVDNGVLLCGYHHRLIHRGHWTVRLGTDRRPEFIPPTWVDPVRRPRRNSHHHPTAYHRRT